MNYFDIAFAQFEEKPRSFLQRGVAPKEAFHQLFGLDTGRIPEGGFSYSRITREVGAPAFLINPNKIDSEVYDKLLEKMRFYSGSGTCLQHDYQMGQKIKLLSRLKYELGFTQHSGYILTFDTGNLAPVRYEGALRGVHRQHAAILTPNPKAIGISPFPDKNGVYPEGSYSVLLNRNRTTPSALSDEELLKQLVTEDLCNNPCKKTILPKAAIALELANYGLTAHGTYEEARSSGLNQAEAAAISTLNANLSAITFGAVDLRNLDPRRGSENYIPMPGAKPDRFDAYDYGELRSKELGVWTGQEYHYFYNNTRGFNWSPTSAAEAGNAVIDSFGGIVNAVGNLFPNPQAPYIPDYYEGAPPGRYRAGPGVIITRERTPYGTTTRCY